MRNVITDSVILPATVDRLFEMYLDPAEHALFTGHPVTIGAERGAKFEAFGGMLSGQMLHVVRPHLIVQSWRSLNFRDEDPDSTLILNFVSDSNQGRIELVHLDVPDHEVKDVTAGWGKHYWDPWRELLET